MCTVIFYPFKNRQIFASLRDEQPSRPTALQPDKYQRESISWIGPIDPEGGGTWFGVNQHGKVVILLNGGFERHQRLAAYGRSRGQIVTDLMTCETVLVEWSLLDLNRIEPFTLVVWENQQLFQLVWDGLQKHRLKMNACQPQIWSSSTLYDADARNIRNGAFRQWVESNPVISKQACWDFFTQRKDAQNGFLINRNEVVKTISYTYLEWRRNAVAMTYQDLMHQTVHLQTLSIRASSDDFFSDCAANQC